eukprot:gnl/TRDRNA2_/TRDRNA2_141009_c1_seq1.p1 gnl/TRDRNA2_/TRDRNA2_141009_c1~~gnl/TRDRNA2_/TRDRNA2_141009_c1_seq1.p1  ORF type:complete len:195 (-),score=12.84 gnl/TRDRNA2_/TRDRNA2_141009_c1_seq1:137-688(-)
MVSATSFVYVALQYIAKTDSARPMVVIAQSSVWDSALAAEVWSLHLGANRIDHWRWLRRAARLIKAIQSSGANVEKLFWRTNPNCPNAAHKGKKKKKSLPALPLLDPRQPLNEVIDGISQMQAEEVREAIRKRVPAWTHVGLIDWRSNYSATECLWVHYHSDGYEKLFELVQAAVVLWSDERG